MKSLRWMLGILLSVGLVVSAAADTKISQFPLGTALQGNELVPMVQGGGNFNTTPQAISTFADGIIQTTAAGTNAVSLTTTKQSVAGYINLQLFSFMAANTSTGSVTVQVGGLAALQLINPSGVQAAAGDVVANSTYVVAFNSTLNSGAGGFIIVNSTPTAVNSVPTGTVVPFAGPSAPNGWLFANGQAVSRTTFVTLFGTIGTTYGAGDGSTTYNLPDLRGRSPFGVDAMGGATAANRLGSNSSAGGFASTAALGSASGSQVHTPVVAEMFNHNHGATGLSAASSGSFTMWNSDSGIGGITGPLPLSITDFTNELTPSGTASVSVGTSISGNTANTGSSTPFNITPPALVLNYIIKSSAKLAIPANHNWPKARAA